jgi:hypothetical protein
VSDEPRQHDPTRRQLRVFGVTVTNYEERTAALLEQAAAAGTPEQRWQAARQIATLTAELNEVVRETTAFVAGIQNRVLTTLAESGD